MARLWLVIVLVACAHDVPRWHQRDEPRRPRAAVVADAADPIGGAASFTPSGEPARRYAEPPPRPPRAPELAGRITGAVSDAARAGGQRAPAWDPRLDAVAAELATLVHGESPPPYEAVEFALAYHGIVEPSPHLLVMGVHGDDEDVVVAELRARLPAIVGAAHFVRVGVGILAAGPGESTIVLALQESGLDLEPLSRSVARGARLTVRGALLAPFTDPKVIVTGQDGAVTDVAVTLLASGRFQAEAACGAAPGVIKVEIAAADAAGSPSILANFPVWCGVAPPRSLTLARAAVWAAADVAGVEQTLFALANQDRQRAGLPALVWDERAAAIARAHSTDMRDRRVVAHVSPTTGNASDRARRGGIATPIVLENLARAYSPDEAEAGLMNSPGHRANLLSTQATHLGVGVAFGDDPGSQSDGGHELYVTQLFYRKTPLRDAGAARQDAQQTLARTRAAAGVDELTEDSELDHLAAGYAARLAKSGGKDVENGVNNELSALAPRFSEIVTVVTVTADLGEPPKGAAVERGWRFYGLGVSQGTHADLGEGAFFVVLLLGKGH